ncbi:hypothetical protein, partial [Rossellomorea sp. SC111]|uniref:hypothetical protein n=1 Tax=Rossellomorea sp. SC111 TaxID=2968985 RepID=UPI00215A3087
MSNFLYAILTSTLIPQTIPFFANRHSIPKKDKSKRAATKSYSFFLFAWRRPTLTGGDPPTTIGAEELNFR